MRSMTVCAVLLLAPTMAAAQSGRIVLPDFSALAKQAKETVNVSLDSNMLKSAGSFVAGDGDDAQTKSMLDGLKAVYVRSYKFDHPDAYSMHDVEAVIHQADGPCWKQLVSVQKSDEHVEIRLCSEGEGGMLIVAAKPLELTIVNLVGRVDLQKLSSLQGSMGVPVIPGVAGASAPAQPPAAQSRSSAPPR